MKIDIEKLRVGVERGDRLVAEDKASAEVARRARLAEFARESERVAQEALDALPEKIAEAIRADEESVTVLSTPTQTLHHARNRGAVEMLCAYFKAVKVGCCVLDTSPDYNLQVVAQTADLRRLADRAMVKP